MDAKTLCLGVLVLGDASGYEIKKQFEEGPFAHFHATGFGSIYPALRSLLEDRLVTCTTTVQDGRPDKKVYSITEAGRAALGRALHTRPAPDSYRSDALFMLFFAELMDPHHARSVFDTYREAYRSHVARMEALVDDCADEIGPGRRFVRGLGLAIYRAVTEHMEAHRDEFLSGIQGGPPDSSARAGAPRKAAEHA